MPEQKRWALVRDERQADRHHRGQVSVNGPGSIDEQGVVIQGTIGAFGRASARSGKAANPPTCETLPGQHFYPRRYFAKAVSLVFQPGTRKLRTQRC